VHLVGFRYKNVPRTEAYTKYFNAVSTLLETETDYPLNICYIYVLLLR